MAKKQVEENNISDGQEMNSPQSTVQNIQKKTKYEIITLWAMTVVALLLPICIIPFTNIGFSFAKFGLVTVASLTAIITITLQVLSERKIEAYSIPNYALICILPIVYTISALFSSSSGKSLIGNGAEIDTAYFFFLGAILMYVGSRVFRTKRSIFVLILGFVSIASLVSLFHVIRFIFGKGVISLGLFLTTTSNTVGGFNELGVYAGLSVLFSVLALELAPISKIVRNLLYVSLTLSLAVVVVTNFNLQSSVFGLPVGISLASLIALFSLVLFIHKKVTSVREKLPVVSLVVLFIALVCTIGISPISNFIIPKLDLAENEILDVRVSPFATYTIASKTYQDGIKNAVLGVGPNKFLIAWGAYKPVDAQLTVNSTPFWNVDFNQSSGFVLTSFVTVGILGGLSWIFFLAMILYYITKLLKIVASPEKDSTSVFIAWSVSMATAYLWVSAILFTTGPTLVFLAFIFTGLLFATLVREEVVQVKTVSWDITTYWKGFILTFSMVVLIAVCMYVGYMWQQRVFASVQVQKAVNMLQIDGTKITEAEGLMQKSINTYYNTNDLRLASDIALIRPTQLIGEAQGIVPPEKITQEIVTDITFAINTARRAAIDRGVSADYRDWLQLGKAYETATFLGSTSTVELAVQSYLQAERLNPTNPISPYLIARLYSFARGFDVAEAKLKRAIELKPDYSDAINLLNSINTLNRKDFKNQIEIPEKSATTTGTTTTKEATVKETNTTKQ